MAGACRFFLWQGAGWDKTGLGGRANGTANTYGHVWAVEVMDWCIVCRNLDMELVKLPPWWLLVQGRPRWGAVRLGEMSL